MKSKIPQINPKESEVWSSNFFKKDCFIIVDKETEDEVVDFELDDIERSEKENYVVESQPERKLPECKSIKKPSIAISSTETIKIKKSQKPSRKPGPILAIILCVFGILACVPVFILGIMIMQFYGALFLIIPIIAIVVLVLCTIYLIRNIKLKSSQKS